MFYLSVALAAVAALCALDLMLTLAVLRRLRDRPDGPAAAGAEEGGLPVGATVGAFTTVGTDGVEITEHDLGDDCVVAFFSAGCPPCRRRLPVFVKQVAALPEADRRAVVAVVVSGGDGSDDFAESWEMAERLAPVARVVREEPDGPVTTAFGVQAFPSQFAVRTGFGAAPRVTAVGRAALAAQPVGSA
ncbi:hypothetical protein [Streptomyces sp. NPDC047985]|uniref:TlpA family protein disulfide reductase n=1 Tax=unclassified Streptomyces TaxID=2593676 RepID=UPI00343C4DBD